MICKIFVIGRQPARFLRGKKKWGGEEKEKKEEKGECVDFFFLFFFAIAKTRRGLSYLHSSMEKHHWRL